MIIKRRLFIIKTGYNWSSKEDNWSSKEYKTLNTKPHYLCFITWESSALTFLTYRSTWRQNRMKCHQKMFWSWRCIDITYNHCFVVNSTRNLRQPDRVECCHKMLWSSKKNYSVLFILATISRWISNIWLLVGHLASKILVKSFVQCNLHCPNYLYQPSKFYYCDYFKDFNV